MAEPGAPLDMATAAACADVTASELLLERLAHDLRGPLSPLQTAAYLLRRPGIEDDRRDELLSIIDRQTTRLSTMVQEVSDWMRACQSKLVGHRGPVALAMLVELAARSSGPGVRTEVPTELEGVEIDGDAQRLVQMFSTLITFLRTRTPDGLVAVRAESNGGGSVVLEIGVSTSSWAAGERDTLFDIVQPAPFDEGLGMRLLIARAIAVAHDGEIIARDAPDGSALIRLQLPSAAPDVL